MQQRFSDGSVEAWAARVGDLSDGELLRVGAAGHSMLAVPRELLAWLVWCRPGTDRCTPT